MKRHIFVDSDGVLADFERGYEILFGHHPHAHNDRDMWRNINSAPAYFEMLPVMPGALRLWAVVAPFNPTILTGCPSSNYRRAAECKRAWFARELGPDVPVITCLSRDKQKHMISPGDILIDDMTKNCNRWTDAGGLAIQHKNAEDTIAVLQTIIDAGEV